MAALARHHTLEQFYADIAAAGIARKDEAGRVVHLHALRKTFQTMSVNAGVNQRATQAILGHSDANTTAKIYTHVPSLGLETEVNKLPWWEPEKEKMRGVDTKGIKNDPLLEKINTLAEMLKELAAKGLTEQSTDPLMAARHGFEP